jgi:hypothetical protein
MRRHATGNGNQEPGLKGGKTGRPATRYGERLAARKSRIKNEKLRINNYAPSCNS